MQITEQYLAITQRTTFRSSSKDTKRHGVTLAPFVSDEIALIAPVQCTITAVITQVIVRE